MSKDIWPEIAQLEIHKDTVNSVSFSKCFGDIEMENIYAKQQMRVNTIVSIPYDKELPT